MLAIWPKVAHVVTYMYVYVLLQCGRTAMPSTGVEIINQLINTFCINHVQDCKRQPVQFAEYSKATILSLYFVYSGGNSPVP